MEPSAITNNTPAHDLNTPPASRQSVAAVSSSDMILPSSVASRADVSRSARELDKLVDYFHQASLRGSESKNMPVLGRSLDEIAKANNINLLHAQDRDNLKTFLHHVRAKAPVVHMSFASEPGAPFLAKIIEWFRKEAHPHTVIHIGLQPELAAGCLVRTHNKSFDFSFRKRFEQSKRKLVTALSEVGKKLAEAEAEKELSIPEGTQSQEVTS